MEKKICKKDDGRYIIFYSFKNKEQVRTDSPPKKPGEECTTKHGHSLTKTKCF